jgi:hypothetical protein
MGLNQEPIQVEYRAMDVQGQFAVIFAVSDIWLHFVFFDRSLEFIVPANATMNFSRKFSISAASCTSAVGAASDLWSISSASSSWHTGAGTHEGRCSSSSSSWGVIIRYGKRALGK